MFFNLLHSERPKLHRVLAVLSAIGFKGKQLILYFWLTQLVFQYVIPAVSTTYHCVGFMMPDFGGKHHVIKVNFNCNQEVYRAQVHNHFFNLRTALSIRSKISCVK